MGLELVELVMHAEEELGIKIRDADVRAVETVGEFHDLVLCLVRAEPASKLAQRPDLEQYLWTRVSALSAEHGYDVMPDQIMPATRFIEDLGYG